MTGTGNDDFMFDPWGKESAADQGPDTADRGADQDAPKKSAAALLVDLAQQRYVFGHTGEGDAYAVARQGGHVVRMLRGGQLSLRAELAAAYRARHHKIAAQQALADAMLVLEGLAQDTDDPEDVHLRVAEGDDGTVWIDLGDKSETVVRVDATGWDLARAGIPVRFQRTKLTGALPLPASGGSLVDLWELLNVCEADRPLVLAWLVAALVRPHIPHPILAVFGEQGTGKSTASRMFVALVDPSPVPLRKPPRDADGWVTAAAGSWVVGLDNLSDVSAWFSDSLCRAATGEGDVRRALYTDGGLAVFAFRRVMLLNGIDVGALRGDLADRALLVTLDRLPEAARRTETQLTEQWKRSYPGIFGALLDEASEALRALPSVRLGSSPRMADFALILAALDQIHGTSGLARYAEQARTMAEDSLSSDPFLLAMQTLVEEFIGTAAELRDLVSPTGEGWRPPSDWPKNARQVTSLLRRNAPALRKSGWTVNDRGLDPDARVLRWQIIPPETVGKPSSESSPSSPPGSTTEEPRMARTEYGQSQDVYLGSDRPSTVTASEEIRDRPSAPSASTGQTPASESGLGDDCPGCARPLADAPTGRCGCPELHEVVA